MSKVTLDNVTTFTNDTTAVNTVNDNSTAIEIAVENTLSRDGTSPNQMEALLDMNSNRIINLPEPMSLSEPLRLQDVITLNGAGTIEIGDVPDGGTTGQVLSKVSNVDQDVTWSTPHYFPTGGSAGQYLTKNTGSDYDTTWTTLPSSGIPNTHQILATLTSLASTTIPGAVTTIQFLGYSTQGDTNPFLFKRVSSPLPFNLGCSQSQDGSWWQYVPPSEGIDARVFGVKPDWDSLNNQLATGGGDTNATDNAIPLQNALNFASIQVNPGFDSGGGAGHRVLAPKGTCMIGSTITVPDGVTLKGTGLYNCVLKMKNTFDNSRNFVILGNQDNSNGIANAQTRGSAGLLTLNGNLVSGGIAYFLSKSIVSIFSTGNDTGITFTIHGTDGDGQTIVETLAGTNAGRTNSNLYYQTVDSISTSGATAGNVTAGRYVYASFDSRLEDIQLWSAHTQAAAGTAMVYSSNTQHTGGVARVQIFAGNRHALRFETGVGGASTITIEDVNCGNYGNSPGVASNNSVIYVNWAGLNFPMKRIVIGGRADPGGVGIEIVGGQVHMQDIHVETLETSILDRVTTINNGQITLDTFIGSGAMDSCVRIASTATTDPHFAIHNLMTNGATYAIKDQRSGGTNTPGNILQWTYK